MVPESGRSGAGNPISPPVHARGNDLLFGIPNVLEKSMILVTENPISSP